MCLVSVGSTLFVIAPIHATLADTGMSDVVQQQLWPTFMKFQIFPMVLQVIIAVWFLNIYMYGNKLGSRIIFTMMSIASTPSNAERPLSGAAAACAATP